jgi:hypothetical protein
LIPLIIGTRRMLLKWNQVWCNLVSEYANCWR